MKVLAWCPSEVYYSGEHSEETRNQLYMTPDLGYSWVTQELPTKAWPETDISTDFITAEIGWFLDSENGTLYQTADQGDTWRKLKTVTWGGDLQFTDHLNGWALAWEKGETSYDRELSLVRTRDGGYTWELLEPVIR